MYYTDHRYCQHHEQLSPEIKDKYLNLFHTEQAVALYKCSFYLPDIDCRIDTTPNIHNDIRL